MILINLLIVFALIARILALYLTRKGIKSGKFIELNPISLRLFKNIFRYYFTNIIFFGCLFFFCNLLPLGFPEYQIIFVILLVHFIALFIDCLYDFILTIQMRGE